MNRTGILILLIGVVYGQRGIPVNVQVRPNPIAHVEPVQVQSQSVPHELQRSVQPVYPRILRLDQDTGFDGSFNYAYETENGISSQAEGVLKNPGQENEAVSVQGSYSYTGDDGLVRTVTYIADENGYRAQGDHLPTPPPIPLAIVRALEYIRSLPPSEDNKF